MSKSKVDLIEDFEIEEIPLDQLLQLHNQTFKYDHSGNTSSDSGIELCRTAAKTYISYLQELCAKRGRVLPVYKEIPFAFLTGFPFGCTVTFTDFDQSTKSCQGFGNCKKDAKQEAAQKMYELITGKSLIPVIVSSNTAVQTAVAANISFINLLQEHAVKYGHEMPTYPNERRIGPDHFPKFEVDCVWRNERTTGQAKTKKMAKTNAAELMWTKFKP